MKVKKLVEKQIPLSLRPKCGEREILMDKEFLQERNGLKAQIKGFFSRLAASRRKQMLDNSLFEISEEELNEMDCEIEEEEFLSSVKMPLV